MVLVANLLADLAYAGLDPRIRLHDGRPGKGWYRADFAGASGWHCRRWRSSAALLAALALLALAAPVIAGALGTGRTRSICCAGSAPSSPDHPLGTDALGRDLLVRLPMRAASRSGSGLAVALLAAIIGTGIGLASGYVGGRWDEFLMRATDGVIALPLLPLLIVLAAIDPAKLGLAPEFTASPIYAVGRIGILIALVGWTTVARLVRGAALSLKEREFVRAAQALGASPARIMLLHILPNLMRPLIVAVTLSVGNIILLEVGAELPRARRHAARAKLGQHADRRGRPHRGCALAGGLAGARHLHDGDGLQPARRRVAGTLRSARDEGPDPPPPALAKSAAIPDLSTMPDSFYLLPDTRGVLAVAGEDRTAFLQGLVSNDVAKVSPDARALFGLPHAAGHVPARFLHRRDRRHASTSIARRRGARI